jgi:hypothetical protein
MAPFPRGYCQIIADAFAFQDDWSMVSRLMAMALLSKLPVKLVERGSFS